MTINSNDSRHFRSLRQPVDLPPLDWTASMARSPGLQSSRLQRGGAGRSRRWDEPPVVGWGSARFGPHLSDG